MRLQMSLDRTDIPTALKLLELCHDVVDIVEVGTPFIIKEGVHAVKTIRKAYPNLTLLADLKIMDGGDYNASQAFDAGANIVTVLAVSADDTVKGAVKSAGKCGGEVFADMISVVHLEERAGQMDQLGVQYVGVHVALDVQASGVKPVGALSRITPVLKNARAAAAGGIDLNTLPDIVSFDPAIVIVGKTITGAANPRQMILDMKKIMNAE